MMRALIIKELRENFKWLVMGLAVSLLLTWAAVPKSLDSLGDSLCEYLGFTGAILAFVLGISQSVWDTRDNQAGFLFHRGQSRNQILASKLIAAAAIYAVALGIPLLLATIYFAAIGPQHLPVRPLQVLEPAILVTLCFLIHPATMLMILRPSRWLGTKLLPLIAPLFICFMFATTKYNSWYWLMAFGMFFTLLVLLGAGIFYPRIQKMSVALGAALASVAILLFGFWIPLIVINLTRKGTWTSFVVDDAGDMWQVKYQNSHDRDGNYRTEFLSGAQVRAGESIDLDAKLPTSFQGRFAYPGTPMRKSPPRYGRIRAITRERTKQICYDDRGYFLVYELKNNKGLYQTITRNGFSSDASPLSDRFDSPFINELYATSTTELVDLTRLQIRDWMLFPDRNGVYLLNGATGEFEKLIDTPISMIYQVNAGGNSIEGFIVETNRNLVHYNLSHSSTDKPLFDKVANYPKLPAASVSSWSLGVAANGTLVAVGWDPYRHSKFAKFIPGQSSTWQVNDIPDISHSTHPPGLPAFIGSVPLVILLPILTLVAAKRATEGSLIDQWVNSEYPLMPVVVWGTIASIAFMLVSAIVVLVLLRNRCTDRRSAIAWLLLSMPLGIGAPLALIAICPKLVFENCPKCDRKRRVDSNKCEHCGSAWEGLPAQGIEIIEGQTLANLSAAQ